MESLNKYRMTVNLPNHIVVIGSNLNSLEPLESALESYLSNFKVDLNEFDSYLKMSPEEFPHHYSN